MLLGWAELAFLSNQVSEWEGLQVREPQTVVGTIPINAFSTITSHDSL